MVFVTIRQTKQCQVTEANEESKTMKILSVLLIAGTVTLGACGSKNDASEANFAKTISQRLDQAGALYFTHAPNEPPMTFPAIYPNNWFADPAADPEKNRLDRLVAAGFLERSTGPGLFITTPGNIYRPTVSGKKIGTQLPFNPKNATLAVDQGSVYAFCYGKVALNKVVDWTPPNQLTHESAVRFTYKVTLNEPWASDRALSARFPEIAAAQQEAASNAVVRVMLMQTEDGWRYE
jgi:hypothetical protein